MAENVDKSRTNRRSIFSFFQQPRTESDPTPALEHESLKQSWSVDSFTNVGIPHREKNMPNQDAVEFWVDKENGRLCVSLGDGIGQGFQSEKVSSKLNRLIVEAFKRMNKMTVASFSSAVYDAFDRTSQELTEDSSFDTDDEQNGSTLMTFYIQQVDDDVVEFWGAKIGDSPCFEITDEGLDELGEPQDAVFVFLRDVQNAKVRDEIRSFLPAIIESRRRKDGERIIEIKKQIDGIVLKYASVNNITSLLDATTRGFWVNQIFMYPTNSQAYTISGEYTPEILNFHFNRNLTKGILTASDGLLKAMSMERLNEIIQNGIQSGKSATDITAEIREDLSVIELPDDVALALALF